MPHPPVAAIPSPPRDCCRHEGHHEGHREGLRRQAVGRLVVLVLAVATAAPGCAGKRRELPPLGEVSGTISLDGQPLPKASVTFVPFERGQASHGSTDDAGRYRLVYTTNTPGAVVGSHRVEIRTGGEGYDKDGVFHESVERLLPRYHTRSELTATVAAGANELDFKLSSAPAKKPK
jgi:hypothetical protein